MVNSSIVLTDAWVQISNDVDYMLQNNSNSYIYVTASALSPTSTANAFKLPAEGVVTSAMLKGIIWVTGSSGKQLVTYAI